MDNVQRNNPSLRARRLCARECIVFLSTISAAGGAAFKELVQDVDVVLHDEGANSLEIDALIPLAAACTNDGRGRLFYVSVGDEKQLPAKTFIDTMLHHSGIYLSLSLNRMNISLFERLISSGR